MKTGTFHITEVRNTSSKQLKIKQAVMDYSLKKYDAKIQKICVN